VTLPRSAMAFRGGMETSLLLLVLVCLWREFLLWDQGAASHSVRTSLRLGTLLAMAFLTRVETICLLPLVLICRTPQRLERRVLLVLLLLPALAVGSYVLWNHLAFETWLPISGRVKSYWWWHMPVEARIGEVFDYEWLGRRAAKGLFGRSAISECPAWARAVHFSCLCIGTALGWRAFAAPARAARLSFPFLTCALILGIDLVAVGPYPWHSVYILLMCSIVGGLFVSRFPDVGLWALVLVALRVGWRALSSSPTSAMDATAGQWLEGNTPKEGRIGSWTAGAIGYFSHRHVMNLDGLVNDASYFRTVYLDHDLDGYLEREGITWVADGCSSAADLFDAYHARAAGERFVLVAVFSLPSGESGSCVWRRIP